MVLNVVHRFSRAVQSLAEPLHLLRCRNILRGLLHASKFRIDGVQLGTERALIVAGKPVNTLSDIGGALLRGGDVLLKSEPARDFGYLRVLADSIDVVSNVLELLPAPLYVVRVG